MRVWREGNRIRDARGTGYGDRVPDSDIIRHIAEAGDDTGAWEFGIAVLGLRAFERAHPPSPEGAVEGGQP